MGYLEEFFKNRDNLYNSFKSFDTKHGLGILNQLSKQKTESKFLSLVTEINFGMFLTQFSDSISYEMSFDKITPDWTIEMNNQKIIAEVVRLNPSAKVKAHLDSDSPHRGIIKFDFRRLHSGKSRLVEKALTYTPIIEKYNLPYIICIYMDIHTWFTKDDLYQSLYGQSEDHIYNGRYSSHSIENALYYSTEREMKNVSGVFLRQCDEYTYYHNFSSANRLNDNNKAIFLNWQHPYE
jgi:hypothetical protein